MASGETMDSGPAGPQGPVGPAKVKRWADRRKTRQQRSTARNWGRSQGLRGDLNPLLWKNRQQHDDIVAWLRWAQAQDQGDMAPAAGPQGDVPIWDDSAATQMLRGATMGGTMHRRPRGGIIGGALNGVANRIGGMGPINEAGLNAIDPTSDLGGDYSVPLNTPFPTQWASYDSFRDPSVRSSMPQYMRDIYARERDAMGPMGATPPQHLLNNQYSGWGAWAARRRQMNPRYGFFDSTS